MSKFNNQLELLVVIVAREKGSKVLHLADEKGIHSSVAMLGVGTASRNIFDYLGLNDKSKVVVMMLAESEKIHDLAAYLVEKLDMNKVNHGIAFTQNAYMTFTGADNDIDRGEIMYNAIYTIVEKGAAEDVIAAAESAGSRGGTIINARGSGGEEARKVFNMVIEPEKEIVLIIAENEKTQDIVKAIREKTDVEKDGKGIVFVCDVTKTYGMKN